MIQKENYIENSLVILNTKLANLLLENDCKLLRIGVNTKIKNRDVYYFEPTEKAIKLRDEFINNKKIAITGDNNKCELEKKKN